MFKTDDYLWTEKYRPHTVKETILPEDIKTIFQSFIDSGNIPNLLLTGPAGSGKTTIAKALCDELDCDYMFLNASKERGIDVLRTKISTYASSMSFDGGRKVIICDEADYMTPEAQAAFRGAIEEFANNCSFIFTCNFKGKIFDAIQSRFSTVEFKLKTADKPKLASQFMTRIVEILTKENIDFDKPVLAEIVKKYFPDYRKTLNELQKYAQGYGKIDQGVLVHVADVSLKDLVKGLAKKDFPEIRKWVTNNSDFDQSKIFRKIYDTIYDHFEKASIPQAILILADYQYKAAFVADQELNLIACLIELMGNCEIKE